MDLNTVSLIGNVGQNPELRYTASGTAVTKVSLASRRWKKSADGNGEEVTSWFDVVVWGKSAENLCRYIGKGDKLGVSGHLEQETWEKDGQKRSAIKIVSENLQFLSNKKAEGQPATEFKPKPKEPYKPKDIKSKAQSYNEPF